jgi:hypothetical protein
MPDLNEEFDSIPEGTVEEPKNNKMLHDRFDALPDVDTNKADVISKTQGIGGIFGAALLNPQVRSAVNALAPTIEGARTGFIRGATAGLLPSVEGAGSTLKEILQDPSKLKDFYDLYRKNTASTRDTMEKAESQAPIASKVGEFAGSMLPIAMGGAGLSSMGIGATKPLLSASSEGLGSLGTELARRAAQAGILTGTGAMTSSSTPITQPLQLGKEGLQAGLTGAAIGGGLNLAGLGLQTAGNSIADTFPFLAKAKTAFNLGEEGTGTVGDKAQEDLQQEARNVANDMTGAIQEQQNQLSNQYEQKAANEAMQNNAGVPVSAPPITTGSELTPLSELPPPLPKPINPLPEENGVLDSNYYNFKQGLRELGTNKPLTRPDRIYNLINQLAGDPKQSVMARDKLTKAVKFISQVNPDLADDLQNKMNQAANNLSVSTPTFKTAMNVTKGTTGAANLLGQVKYNVDNSILGSLMTSLPPSSSANAVMFNMLQNPETRSLFTGEEKEQK